MSKHIKTPPKLPRTFIIDADQDEYIRDNTEHTNWSSVVRSALTRWILHMEREKQRKLNGPHTEKLPHSKGQ